MYQGLDLIGYRLAGWTWGMWDFDWGRERQADRLAPRLARKASDGDIIVIHDGHHVNPRADRRHAAETVRRLVPALRRHGFVFKPLCEEAFGGMMRRDG
jgi:peptidoglycan/xylan/chitin deacetylase (PgdA/CDA1 family)